MNNFNKTKIIIFDGICLLCNKTVYFLHNKLRYMNYKFIPSQSEEGQNLIIKYSLSEISQNSIVLIKNNGILIKSDAMLNIIDDMPKIWHILKLFRIIPKTIRDSVYTWISKNRHIILPK